MALSSAIAAIEFAITCTEPQAFLKCWLEGDWEVLKKEWPEAYSDIFPDEIKPSDIGSHSEEA